MVPPPESETVGPEETYNSLLGCLGLAPLQPKRESADPPDDARNDLGDREDRFLRCLGQTPQHPRSIEWHGLIKDQTPGRGAGR